MSKPKRPKPKIVKTEILDAMTDNETFIDNLFPPEKEIVVPLPKDLPYTPNYIIWRNMILYGGQGSGKSELVRKLVEIAVERYGEESINALQVPAGRIELAYNFLNNKPIQIVFIDDFTLVKHDKETLNKFFRIRHIWKEISGRSNGYILTIMGVHRFHAIQPEFRTNFDFLVCRSSPDNKYDKDFLKAYFNSKFIALMNKIEIAKWKNRKLFSYTLWRDKAERQGFIKLGMSKRNYFDEIKYDETIPEGYLISHIPANVSKPKLVITPSNQSTLENIVSLVNERLGSKLERIELGYSSKDKRFSLKSLKLKEDMELTNDEKIFIEDLFNTKITKQEVSI